MEQAEFQIGQKVTTPQGGGLIKQIQDGKITVRLDTGKLITLSSDKVADDSDAG